MSSDLVVRPMGPHAVLIDDPPGGPAGWATGCRALIAELALPGVLDVVPAERTVLVRTDSATSLARIGEVLADVRAADRLGAPRTVVVPVVYDGADLDAVATAAGLDVDAVIATHTGVTYRVAFCGFAPGFAYLSGLDRRLELPRRATPRTAVPAGSVAIASAYSAVYPRASPGGWHLLGRTDSVVFDPDRDPPALLAPGDAVRFEAI